MNLEKKLNQAIWWALQELKKEDFATPKDEYIYFEYQSTDKTIPTIRDQKIALKFLEKESAIKIRRNKYSFPMISDDLAELYNLKPIGCFLSILQPKFNNLYLQYEKKYSFAEKEETNSTKNIPNKFVITIKDKEIWINKYLLSKPHAVGDNFEFFECIRSQPINTKIDRNNVPNSGGLALKRAKKNKSFIKTLNELGFKGEILKAFFPKRSKNIVVYRGDRITREDLEKSGIKISLFIKELEVADTKNSPE